MAGSGSPTFEIALDGNALGPSTLKHLLKAELRESLHEIDAFTLTMVVPQDPSEVVDLAKPGSSFSVTLKDSDSERQIKGSIVEVAHSRSVSSPWVVTFIGLDKMHTLTRKRKSKSREGSDATIVKEIAGECGLSAEVEDVSATGDFTLQLNETYAQFLLRVADQNDYIVRVEEDSKLRFSRRMSAYQSDSVTVTWGEQIEHVELRASVRDLITSVKVRGYNPVKGEWVSGSASSSDLAKFSGGTTGVELAESAFGAWTDERDNARASTTSKAKAMAKAALQNAANNYVSGTVECNTGVPAAVSGAKLTIEDAGDPMNGDFVIRETVHTLTPDEGYRTVIHFFSDSLPS